MSHKIEKDAITGTETTGHEWDGVRELNTPVPTWWIYTFFASIAVAIVMFVLYPAIPLGRTHTDGVLGTTTRSALDQELAQVGKDRAVYFDKIKATSLADIQKDKELLNVALIAGKSAFGNNCAPCHGPAGSGRVGYPNLQDDVWIWGGSLEAIHQTITVGVRSTSKDTRVMDMPHFGADGTLKPDQINQVADFVWTKFYGHTGGTAASIDAGSKIFAENCAACHGENGEGSQDMGAPKLNSATHLYADARQTIVNQVTLPHQGVMPTWGGKLDEATIKSLTLYVHSLGGGQ